MAERAYGPHCIDKGRDMLPPARLEGCEAIFTCGCMQMQVDLLTPSRFEPGQPRLNRGQRERVLFDAGDFLFERAGDLDRMRLGQGLLPAGRFEPGQPRPYCLISRSTSQPVPY